MVERARDKGVMTQMGIQISSAFTERHAVALIQMGAIGKVKEAHTFSNKKWGDLEVRPAKSDPIPEGFNWDKWASGGACGWETGAVREGAVVASPLALSVAVPMMFAISSRVKVILINPS